MQCRRGRKMNGKLKKPKITVRKRAQGRVKMGKELLDRNPGGLIEKPH